MGRVSIGPSPRPKQSARASRALCCIPKRPWLHGSALPHPLTDRSHWRLRGAPRDICMSTIQQIHLRTQPSNALRLKNVEDLDERGELQQQRRQLRETHVQTNRKKISLIHMHMLMGKSFMDSSWRHLNGTRLGEQILSQDFTSHPAPDAAFSDFEDVVVRALHRLRLDPRRISLFLRRSEGSVVERMLRLEEERRLLISRRCVGLSRKTLRPIAASSGPKLLMKSAL